MLSIDNHIETQNRIRFEKLQDVNFVSQSLVKRLIRFETINKETIE